MQKPDDDSPLSLDFLSSQDEIVINLEDLPPEPEMIVISDVDLAAVTPLPEIAPAHTEDLGQIDIPDIPCAICHAMIEPGQAFGQCKSCQTPYHKDCWDYNSGCAVLGCQGARKPRFFQPATSF